MNCVRAWTTPPGCLQGPQARLLRATHRVRSERRTPHDQPDISFATKTGHLDLLLTARAIANSVCPYFSLYLGRVITEKNGEIAALPLVARNDGAVRYDLLGMTSSQLGQYPPI